MPPPAKVLADADVRLIVPAPVTVRFVDGAALKPPVPEIVQVPEPKASVLVELELLAMPPEAPDTVTLYVDASKVPETWLMADDELKLTVKASCRVNDPPGLSH